MQMIVDAALITKKSASLDYNTDSVNAAGKIWSREIVHSESGIKAAGKSQGKPYYVLASANAKGTAESAADLFKNCVSSFLPDGSNYSESIADFFRAFAQVLNKSGYESGACDLAVFAGYNDRVYLAKSGKARLFRYSEDDFFEAKPQLFPHDDSAANYGVSVYSDIKPGDIFVLLSGKVGAYISESLIKAIIRNSNGDIKRIVALIASNAVKNGCDEAVSAIVLKIDGEDADVPVTPAAPASFVAAEEIENDNEAGTKTDPETISVDENDSHSSHRMYYMPTEEDIEEETESTEKINRYKSRNKFSRVAVIDVCIVIAVIAVLLGVLAVKGVFGSKSGKSTKDGVNVSDLFTEAETTKKNKNDKETTEATTEEKTTAGRNDTTTSPRTTSQTPTQRQQTTPTTRTPVVTQPTTQRPVVTEPPATEPPATEPPATEPPVTNPPPTDPPVTDPPATDPPVTRDPNIADDD